MHVILKESDKYLIRFDRGEEVIEGLAVFAREQNIHSASFSALGAAECVRLSFYNGATKKYEDTEIKEGLEIAAFSGNIAWKEGGAIVHAHGVFSDRHMKTVGGHVKTCVVSFTCEVSVSVFGTKVERQFDSSTGLNMLV